MAITILDLNDKVELQKKIDEKAPLTAVSSPYNFKGNCLFAELPTRENSVNDTYYCTDVKCKYTWNGTGWYQSSLNETDYEAEFSEIHKSFESLYGMLDTKTGPNLIDPSNAESGYYEGTTPVSNARYQRTTNPINIEGNDGELHFRTNISTSELVCVIFIDSAGSHIRSTSRTFDILYEGDVDLSVPDGCTQIHLWISGANNGNTLGNVCVSFESLESFEAYAPPEYKVKKGAIPEDLRIGGICGKTVVNFGDSIFGNYRPPVDISTFIADATGATAHNCGFGGCRMGTHSRTNYGAFSMFRLADAVATGDFSVQDAAIADTAASEPLPAYFSSTLALLKSIDFSTVDIVTIAYGTNDFAGENQIDDAQDAFNTSAFAGALRYSIERILSAYPHLRIFICTPTYRFWLDNSLTDVGYTFSSDTVFDSDTCTNPSGDKLTSYAEKAKEVAQAYHLPCIDNYHELGLNRFNRSVYFTATDGTHPNETGRRLIAAHIAHELF